jgi:hypothetical protein
MTYFSQPKSKKIEVDPHAVSSRSPAVQQRIDRIVENYQRLDLMLSEIESKIQNDQRLNEIDQSILEIELQVDGRRRKWRPRRKTVNPKKPR